MERLDRRRFLGYFAVTGLSATLLPSVLLAQAEKEGKITKEMLAEAEKVAGLSFTEPERDLMLKGLDEALASYEKLRAIPLDNSVPPAMGFQPTRGALGAAEPDKSRDRLAAGTTRPPRSTWSNPSPPRVPDNIEELAFLPVTQLSALLRTRKVSSVELTRMYLDRLQRCNAALHCVVTPLEERALAAARRADDEIGRRRYRGPLHGVPWGVKDLFAVKGGPTTWGARPFRDQVIDEDATVVQRLDAAGAVLLAKLSCGALAWGDVWFGGTTRNPWKLDQGSSGSSAGSASAAAAGCIGFGIGTETYGSIVSPSTRCGATGLRPSFGRVSRAGCMALSWSLDKVGPLARSVEDCALVFDAIHGADPGDPDSVSQPFLFDAGRKVSELRVGYLTKEFGEKAEDDRAREWQALDAAALEAVRGLGVDLKPVALPDYLADDMMIILTAEAGAAFDAFSRSTHDDEMVRQTADAWPNVFRQAQLVPAVDYLRAARIRTLMMADLRKTMADYDVIVAPTFGGSTVAMMNLAGLPQVVLPSGFRKDGTPVSITFCGGLYGEGPALQLARAYQEATGWHRRTPSAFGPGASPPATEAFLTQKKND